MGKIVISENVSLDGVVEDPTGDEGCRHGGWFSQARDQDLQAWAETEFHEVLGADAVLLGRRSYEFFASRWPSRTGAWAERLNTMPKYVVSSTLTDPEWTNSTVLQGDVVSAVTKLRRQFDGEIVVYASRPLVHTLLEHDLADELRLIVFPVVLGGGERLFGETNERKPLRLLGSRTVGDGLTQVSYSLARV
jgi:dihydrofolate reductase